MTHHHQQQPEQRQDIPSRQRIEQLEIRYTRVARLLLGLSVFTLAAAIAGIVIVGRQSDAINNERFRNVKRACVEQAQRHDQTVRRLDAGLAAAVALHPQSAARIRRSRDFTVALIDALAPRRPDCEAYAKAQVSGS